MTSPAIELMHGAIENARGASDTMRSDAPRAALPRNAGTELDLDRVAALRVNAPAVGRRVQSLAARRSVKKEYQAAWLLKAIQCIDLTTLSGDDTPGRVRRLCAKALHPVRADLLAALGVSGLRVGAVCVYHDMVAEAVRCVGPAGLPVAAVSTGFPAGLSAFETRLREIELSVAAGAREIDIVISRRHALLHDWRALYDEVRAFRTACGEAHMKTILATGELQTLENVARASWVCMMAGADFIKTSTGKEGVNATLDVSLVMVRAIRDFHIGTGFHVGYKPAGGISTARAATQYLTLMREELGAQWIRPELFRIGASSLLTDIERQLEHHVTGAYSAAWRHPLP
jgi:deoxyribose-phosphate aldolase